MRASVIAAALLTVFPVAAVAQTTPAQLRRVERRIAVPGSPVSIRRRAASTRRCRR